MCFFFNQSKSTQELEHRFNAKFEQNIQFSPDFYSGPLTELPVYIQSHALKRMQERLNLLGEAALNYALWENTHTLTEFQAYQGYLLLPFNLYKIKTAYLAANVIDNKLIFRTFLFITHNSTLEGDLLKK